MASPNRFLIDECLSPRLARSIAIDDIELTHINFRGLRERKDWTIADWCIANDHVLITNNARDFLTIYRERPLHPGLIIVRPNVEFELTGHLLSKALDHARRLPSLVNTVVEISLDGVIAVYIWPTPKDAA